MAIFQIAENRRAASLYWFREFSPLFILFIYIKLKKTNQITSWFLSKKFPFFENSPFYLSRVQIRPVMRQISRVELKILARADASFETPSAISSVSNEA